MAQQGYYRPYISDSESDTSSETDSTTSSLDDTLPNYRQFASDLQLLKAAGPDFVEPDVQIELHESKNFSVYIPIGPSVQDNSGVEIPKTESSKTDVTSIIMLDSRDRDKAVYPQPTSMSLRLPRTYQKIKNFQVVQMKLLSSFFYFRPDKNNLDISIHEFGRFFANGTKNIMRNEIREGTYDIQSLINEITIQLNRTPIFYDYPNGFTDFAPLFAVSGDFSLSFNQPGDNYFDALNNVFINNPTMALIVSKYFNTATAGRTSYTINELKVAYYYPVLKEMLLDARYDAVLDLAIPATIASFLIFQETVRSRCIYTFQGLGDLVVQFVINRNIVILDEYRVRHTFRTSLINKYALTYAPNNNRIIFTSSQLNTSLFNLLTLKYNQFLVEQLNKYELSPTEFAQLSVQNNILISILTDEYYFLQRNFAQFFGIQFNSYALDYFTVGINELPLQNGFNSVGISSNYDSNVIINNINPQIQNELTEFRVNPRYYWPGLTNLPNPTISSIVNLNSSINPTSIQQFSHPFNRITFQADEGTPFINSNGKIYQNRILRSADIVAPVNPTEYTTFEFKSDVRQQLRISAFPRPTKFRYPEYNLHAFSTLKTYDLSNVKIFDNSYAFVESAQNRGMDISPIWAASNLTQFQGFTPTSQNFGISLASSIALQPSVNLNVQRNRLFYTFTTPHPSTAGANDPVTYPFSLAISPSNLASPMNVFLYHDRGAFMADVSDVRNEKLIHYKAQQLIIDSNSRTLSFTAYSKQKYYLLLRSASTIFTSMDIRVAPYFPNGSNFTTLSTNVERFDPLQQTPTNFIWAKVGDPNFIRLPTTQLTSNNGVDTNFSRYTLSNVPMGYDVSGVSTDLTAYVGYIQNSFCNTYPTSVIRIDPVSGFIFQVGRGYNSNTNVYIPNLGNGILSSNAAGPYTPQTLSNRESLITHYYNNVFIPNSRNQQFIPDGLYSQIYTVNEQNVLTSITSYPFSKYIASAVKSNVVIDSNLQDVILSVDPQVSDQDEPDLKGYAFQDGKLSLGNGVMGISLIPEDGVWDVKRIMLRSAFSSNDPFFDTNRQIQHLGIYFASYLNTLTGQQVKLSNALMIFDFSKAVTYPQGSNTNFGFDTVGGTYYEWVKSTTRVPASNSYLYGFAQTPRSIVPDSNSMYSIVPFTAQSNLTTYSLLSGSVVPYPFFSDASACSVYFDGSKDPFGKSLIRPNTRTSGADLARGPPAGFDETQSKYEQSIPMGTTMLQFLQPPLLSADVSGCNPFGPPLFKGITGSPIFSLPNPRVANYILMPIGGVYNLYAYENDSLTNQLKLENTITPDIFFTNFPYMQMAAMSGNTTEFAFLGISQLANYKTQYFPASNAVAFQIETYNPKTGSIISHDTLVANQTPISLPSNLVIYNVHSFNYNDNGGYTFAFNAGTWDSNLSAFTNKKEYAFSFANPRAIDPSGGVMMTRDLEVSSIRTVLLQAQRELFGRFYIADFVDDSNYYSVGTLEYPRRPVLSNLFFVDTFTPNFNQSDPSFPQVVPLAMNNSSPQAVFQGGFPKITKLALKREAVTGEVFERNGQAINYTDPAFFTDITIVQNPFESRLFLSCDLRDLSNNNGLPSAPFYEVTNYTYNDQTTSNAFYRKSKQEIKNSALSTIQAEKIMGGGGGSFWMFFNEGLRTPTTSNKYDSIWGNRGDSVDFPINISNAPQIFYPTQRVVLTKVAPSYNPITDISDLLPFPEYPHTSLFVYDNSNKFMTDISSNKWGLESSNNFLVSDTQFSGYTFNSATLGVPLQPSTTYYMALRGYTPTEKSQVLLRFSLPNQYDFGYVKIADLSNEIPFSMLSPNLFNSNYKNVLQQFNSNFLFGSTGQVFGSNALQGFPGSNLSNVTGFGDFLNRFTNLYNVYTSNVQILNIINTTVSSNLQNFIRNDLINIIPPNAINRQRYTDPVRYDILWNSSLLPIYQKAEDNWGLGWNLGFSKVDTDYDTTHVAQSFYKILDDYINLRLNPEFDMNRMDTGAKENLQQTKESTGATKAYHAKLLLAPFGSYAQTLISNPISFQIPIPKIDKLTFTWTDSLGITIDNSECEWNMVVQLVEETDTVKAAAPPVYKP